MQSTVSLLCKSSSVFVPLDHAYHFHSFHCCKRWLPLNSHICSCSSCSKTASWHYLNDFHWEMPLMITVFFSLTQLLDISIGMLEVPINIISSLSCTARVCQGITLYPAHCWHCTRWTDESGTQAYLHNPTSPTEKEVRCNNSWPSTISQEWGVQNYTLGVSILHEIIIRHKKEKVPPTDIHFSYKDASSLILNLNHMGTIIPEDLACTCAWVSWYCTILSCKWTHGIYCI